MEGSKALVLFRMGLFEQTEEDVAQHDIILRNLRAKYARGSHTATVAAAGAENNGNGTPQKQGIEVAIPKGVSESDIVVLPGRMMPLRSPRARCARWKRRSACRPPC